MEKIFKTNLIVTFNSSMKYYPSDLTNIKSIRIITEYDIDISELSRYTFTGLSIYSNRKCKISITNPLQVMIMEVMNASINIDNALFPNLLRLIYVGYDYHFDTLEWNGDLECIMIDSLLDNIKSFPKSSYINCEVNQYDIGTDFKRFHNCKVHEIINKKPITNIICLYKFTSMIDPPLTIRTYITDIGKLKDLDIPPDTSLVATECNVDGVLPEQISSLNINSEYNTSVISDIKKLEIVMSTVLGDINIISDNLQIVVFDMSRIKEHEYPKVINNIISIINNNKLFDCKIIIRSNNLINTFTGYLIFQLKYNVLYYMNKEIIINNSKIRINYVNIDKLQYRSAKKRGKMRCIVDLIFFNIMYNIEFHL